MQFDLRLQSKHTESRVRGVKANLNLYPSPGASEPNSTQRLSCARRAPLSLGGLPFTPLSTRGFASKA